MSLVSLTTGVSVDKVGLLFMYEVKVVSDLSENELWGVMFTLDQIVSLYISRTPADPPRTPREKL